MFFWGPKIFATSLLQCRLSSRLPGNNRSKYSRARSEHVQEGEKLQRSLSFNASLRQRKAEKMSKSTRRVNKRRRDWLLAEINHFLHVFVTCLAEHPKKFTY